MNSDITRMHSLLSKLSILISCAGLLFAVTVAVFFSDSLRTYGMACDRAVILAMIFTFVAWILAACSIIIAGYFRKQPVTSVQLIAISIATVFLLLYVFIFPAIVSV